jgi:hypothetical protein
VNLKNRLGDVETNGRGRLHGKLLRIMGALIGARIFCTLMPVEEPSTASGQRTNRSNRAAAHVHHRWRAFCARRIEARWIG